jgi:glycogen synthase
MNISRLLAEAGETVHVIGWLWEGAQKRLEVSCDGRLIIHRVLIDEVTPGTCDGYDSSIVNKEIRGLGKSPFWQQSFTWQAGLLTEALIDKEGIDLIETQDYSAPLYYFQLRRALGLGPKRCPPCLLHFHTPTEFVVRHNDLDLGHPNFLTAKRHEDYSIAAADAMVCPSHFLARQIETLYGLDRDSITVIRYPIGDVPVIDRFDEIWRRGTICYFGRLEPRKGVIEWVEAAVRVAEDNPSAQFEFIGADLPYTNWISVQRHVEMHVPDHLKSRFHFRGSRPRSELFNFLKQARMAVVPSRWENFPNTCIEAMCSGLPVIASPSGGMAEMIRDGETGWLADNAKSDGLEAALRRALATSPLRLAEMGLRASVEIRQLCDNKKTVENHLHFRREVVKQGLKRSFRLPVNLPWSKRPLCDESARRSAGPRSAKGLAFVVECTGVGGSLDNCLDSLERQTRKPATVVLISARSSHESIRPALQRARSLGWRLCEGPVELPQRAKNAAIEEVFSAGMDPLGVVFLDAMDRLDPNFSENCELVLQNCPEVGLVSFWTQYVGDRNVFVANPCPAFPYQWLFDDTVPATAVRTEALREAGLFRVDLHSGIDHWDLVNGIMASGWVAVTVPALLNERRIMPFSTNRPPSDYSRMRSDMLARFPDLIARDSLEMIKLLESRMVQLQSSISSDPGRFSISVGRNFRPRDIVHLTLSQQVALAQKVFRDPGAAVRFLWWSTLRSARQTGARLLKILTGRPFR